LYDLLEPYGEILTVTSEDGDYYAYNCTNRADILDYEKSTFLYELEENNELLNVDSVNNYSFELTDGRLATLPFFRLKCFDSNFFVNHHFVERIQQHSLHGFWPVKIWPFPQGVSWKDLHQNSKALRFEAVEQRRRERKGQRPIQPPLEPLEFLTL
jgi:hypothetical protein